jgi:predicted metal-dependent hydrolase
VSEPVPPSFQRLEEAIPSDLLRGEVWAWARKIGVEPKEIHLRRMRHKWASCSSNGRLTFNTDLLREPADFRVEVIVHELLHLRLPNHGRLFRALLKAYLADSSR